ncbi:S8 family serine peptidase [Pontibacter litorisediminis]|uniref:S8 family serine peptidase n=1 Tax=Pontibacter litorisediminis TaxID=1846260 RepID=UPI0023EB3852|nr:S8 family serine peptidase [Pontibacter litorisediminis]
MISNLTLRRSVALAAMVAAVSLTGCQKEELMENQFASPEATFSSQDGQAIEGQYIVVFKNGSTSLSTSNTQGLKASKVEAAMKRERVLTAAKVEAREVSQVYEGVVNGFAARLSPEQLASLRQNPEVAYVEQDRIIALAPKWKDNTAPTSTKGNGKGGNTGGETTTNGGKGNNKNTTEPAPTEPTPVDPAPSDTTTTAPAPTEPAPTEPAPTEPEPTVPSEPAPAYATVTPLAGETVPWNVERVGYGDGTGKTVWVIDSGIDTDHPDLNIDVARSFSFIYGNPSIEDGYGHGTSVAGVIAAKNNGSGMLGVASNATIIALRVFDDAGAGTVSRAISAVNHVSNNGKPGDVVNMSLGSGISSTLDNAVMNAAAKGILFAIAAGNSNVDCSGTSPARVNAPGVYTISAMDSYNRMWSSSNFGAGVDFAAPGVNVTATNKTGGISGGHYGTSLAAPHVAGILALRGEVLSQGYITGDKDSTPDPIASVK